MLTNMVERSASVLGTYRDAAAVDPEIAADINANQIWLSRYNAMLGKPLAERLAVLRERLAAKHHGQTADRSRSRTGGGHRHPDGRG